MQVKANLVIVAKPDGTNQTFENVNVIQGGNGLFIEHEVIIGKDNEGNDLKRNTFTLFPWEKVSLMEWNEPTLIEQVKNSLSLRSWKTSPIYLRNCKMKWMLKLKERLQSQKPITPTRIEVV